jgi:hypothetical protein
MLKLYAQLTEIRKHAEKKCRKILTPDSEFSPTIRMWYDRIHVYKQLIRLKEGKSHKARNTFRFARKNNILHPEKLTLEELNDGLQLASIRNKELKKQAGELRKAHLRECLLQAQPKRQPSKVRAIKQQMQRENSKKVWYVIKHTVKDPRSPSVLKVQQVVNGEVQEFQVQEEIERAIQEECEVRFTLAHSAPIMSNLLGERLRYLSDEDVARQIIAKEFKQKLSPAIVQDSKDSFLAASLDALNSKNTTIYEIKCGAKSYAMTSSTDKVPSYYVAQLQHMLMVTQLDSLSYASYRPGEDLIILEVYRDESYIKDLRKKEIKFVNDLVKLGHKVQKKFHGKKVN